MSELTIQQALDIAGRFGQRPYVSAKIDASNEAQRAALAALAVAGVRINIQVSDASDLDAVEAAIRDAGANACAAMSEDGAHAWVESGGVSVGLSVFASAAERRRIVARKAADEAA